MALQHIGSKVVLSQSFNKGHILIPKVVDVARCSAGANGSCYCIVLFEPGDDLSEAQRGDGWDIGGCLKEHFLNSSFLVL